MSKEHTIVHFSQDFAPGKAQLGGFSRVRHICLDKNHHVIFTIAHSSERTATTHWIDRATVVCLPAPRKRIKAWRYGPPANELAQQVVRELVARKIQPDLLFGHSQLLNFHVLKRVAHLLGIRGRLIWEVNAIWGTSAGKGVRGHLSRLLIQSIQARVFRTADAIVCQTNASREYIQNTLKHKNVRCIVATNAVVPEEWPVHQDHSAQCVAAAKPLKVLCLGLFDAMNGIPMALECLKRTQFTRLEFHFLGKGKFLAAVVEMERSGRCVYRGVVSHKEMPALLPTFDAILIPRLPCAEADLFIPTKLLEALAAGLIPVCSNVRGMAEVLDPKLRRFMFEAGNVDALTNALTELQNTPADVLRRLAAEGRKHMEDNYRWNERHATLQQLYVDLTTGSRVECGPDEPLRASVGWTRAR